jgi:hypothetical protein
MIECVLEYTDDYVRSSGSWRFARRKLRFWWAVPTAEQPIWLSSSEWPEVLIGRGTLPQSWPSWQKYFNGDGPAALRQSNHAASPTDESAVSARSRPSDRDGD